MTLPLRVIVSRGHNEGDYLNQLIAILNIQTRFEPLEKVLTVWIKKALGFKPRDVVYTIALTALATRKISLDNANTLVAVALESADKEIAEEAAKTTLSVGIYAH